MKKNKILILMQLLGSILLLFLLIILVAPGFIGRYVEKRQNNWLQQVVAVPGVQIKVLQAKRGWFRSQALMQVTVDPRQLHTSILPRLPWQHALVFNMSETIHYGPLVFSHKSGHWHAHWALAWYQGASKEAAVPLVLDVFLRPSGFFAQYALPQLQQSMRAGSFILQDVLGDLSVKPSQDYPFSGVIQIGNLHYSISDKKQPGFVASGVNYAFKLKNIALFTGGEHALSMQELSYPSANQHLSVVQGLWLYVQQSVHGRFSNGNITWHVNKYMTGSTSSGPYHMDLSFVRLSNLWVRRFQEMWMLNPVLDVHFVRRILSPDSALLQIGAQGFRASLRVFSAHTAQGELRIDGKWVVDKQPAAELQKILQASHININCSMPVAWLSANLSGFYQSHLIGAATTPANANSLVQQQIKSWLAAKYLLRHGDKYKTNIVYKHGLLRLNPQVSDSLASYKNAPAASLS